MGKRSRKSDPSSSKEAADITDLINDMWLIINEVREFGEGTAREIAKRIVSKGLVREEREETIRRRVSCCKISKVFEQNYKRRCAFRVNGVHVEVHSFRSELSFMQVEQMVDEYRKQENFKTKLLYIDKKLRQLNLSLNKRKAYENDKFDILMESM